MKRFLLIYITALLMMVGCSIAQAVATFPEGNIKIFEIGDTTGKTQEGLEDVLGNPANTGKCQVHLKSPVTHKLILVPGTELVWYYIIGSTEKRQYVEYMLAVCLLDGKVVGESRQWKVLNSGRIVKGESHSLDRDLARDLISRPKESPALPDGEELEI